MELIFCRCGGSEVILMVPHPQFCTFFSAGSAPSIPHRKFGSAPVHGAEGGAEVPTSVQHLWCSEGILRLGAKNSVAPSFNKNY